MIIEINENEMRKNLAHTYTVKDFEKNYLSLLKNWYQKDNNGKSQPKPKLSILDGQSYDKTYNSIEKLISKISNKNMLLTNDFLNKIKKELQKYKGKKSKEKLKYVK